MSAIMTSRQAAELDHAFERNGWTATDVKKISEGDMLAKLKLVLDGLAEVTMRKHVVDGDADPFCPPNWKVESHRKMGKIDFDPSKLDLYLSEGQKKGVIGGEKLRKEIEKLEGVMNANWLEFFLANTHLIPESWNVVVFWGTIYRVDDGNLCVRYLYRGGDAWGWGSFWLGSGFDDSNPAARLRK